MVSRVEISWSIPNAGPSVSVMHFQDGPSAQSAADLLADIRPFFIAAQGYLPNDVTISFPSEIAHLNIATGELESVEPVVPPASVTGTVSGAWAGGSGGRVVWGTNNIHVGRRVRGTTFLVPLAGSAFGTDGRMTGPFTTAMTTAGNALIAAAEAGNTRLSVYSRPVRPSSVPPITVGRPGALFSVVSASVPGVAASLRGRKY